MSYMQEVKEMGWKEFGRRMLWALSFLIVSLIYPLVNKPRPNVRNLETVVDKMIPFNAHFIIPYVIWYIYVGLFLVLLCIVNEKAYYNMLKTLIVGALICAVIFIVFPTTVPRPVLEDTTAFNWMVNKIYSSDLPYNCFPSIHVYNSAVIAIFVNREKKFKLSTKICSTVVSISIMASTLFIKQHYFWDLVAGVVLAYVCYALVILSDERLSYKKLLELIMLNKNKNAKKVEL